MGGNAKKMLYFWTYGGSITYESPCTFIYSPKFFYPILFFGPILVFRSVDYVPTSNPGTLESSRPTFYLSEIYTHPPTPVENVFCEWALSKKYQILIKSFWNLAKIINSWAFHFVQVSWRLNKLVDVLPLADFWWCAVFPHQTLLTLDGSKIIQFYRCCTLKILVTRL